VTRRNWFTTGVNRGFGRHMTEQLLARGDRVAGNVRKMEGMNDLKAKYDDLQWLAHLDVTDTPDIREVVNKAFADLGKIDAVVNNAGYGLFGPNSLQRWTSMMALRPTGFALCFRTPRALRTAIPPGWSR